MPTGQRNMGATRDPARTRTKKDRYAMYAPDAIESAKSVVIEQPTILSVGLEITGTADLIQNRFSQKSVEQMLRKHMGISVQRESKKPREVLEDATVKNLDGRIAMPPTGLKLAMIGAASQLKGLKKTQLRTALFVQGNSIPITYDEMVPRMDITRTSGIGRVPDVRFRPSFRNWKARLIIQFADVVTVQTVVDLLNRAGHAGIGEWRPEKNGSFGTFRVTRHIDTPEELGTIASECASPLEALTIPSWALDMEIDPVVLQKIFASQNGHEQESEVAA
jgi:hypothetical protein